MASDYIRTARAGGLSRVSIVLKHAGRNAAMPVVAIAAVQLGFMLGGSIVTESVFNLPGVGYLAWESISKNDFPVVQAVVLILAVIYIALTLGADLLNAVLDPRLRTARCLTRHLATGLGALILAVTVLAALFGPALVPQDPFAQDLLHRLTPPAWLGRHGRAPVRDRPAWTRLRMARLVYGARISLLIGACGSGDERGHRHHARRAGRVLRRAGGRRGDVRHHVPALHPADPRGAGRRVGRRIVACPSWC